jgi:hypothetical protein
MTNGMNGLKKTNSRGTSILPSNTNKLDDSNDVLAVVLSRLMGANVVTKSEFDKVNEEKELLLTKSKDIDTLRGKFLRLYCKFLSFKKYHSKWKPVTRNIERRLSKLRKEKVYIEFDEYPKDISENLKEAYNCYAHGLNMSCYIMVLRTIEIAINIIYEKENPIEYDKNNKPKFIPALNKLNWAKNQKIIGGADYNMAKAFIETRNDCVHEIITPTDKQMLSAFESVLIIVNKTIN